MITQMPKTDDFAGLFVTPTGEAFRLEETLIRLPIHERFPVGADLWYRGTHHYASRSADGYSIDDMLAQIENGLSPTSQVTVDRFGRPNLVNQTPRADGYGNNVRDTVTFETSGSKNPQLFSVIPKGDFKKPNGK
jgi:hypothetical protein